MGVKFSANQVLTGRELAEAKRREKLEEIRASKKASKTKNKGLSLKPVRDSKAVKPKLTGRDAAEARAMEMAEKVRKDRKATKAKKTASSPTSARKRSSVPIRAKLTRKESAGVIPKLGPNPKIAKQQAAADKKFDALIKRIEGKLKTVKKTKNPTLFESLMDQLKNINRGKVDNKNMGGMMSKKKSGYMSGGQSKLDKTKDGKISAADFKLMNKGGMSKKGKSGYMYGGMTKKKKK